MTERPIIFSGPMVRAIRADTKRQTRRVVKPPSHQKRYAREVLGIEATNNAAGMAAKACLVRDDWSFCPYGVPGDRLYVKEAAWLWCERQPNGLTRTGRTKWRYKPMRAAGVWYAADHRRKPNISVVSPDTGNEWGWRLKIGRRGPGRRIAPWHRTAPSCPGESTGPLHSRRCLRSPSREEGRWPPTRRPHLGRGTEMSEQTITATTLEGSHVCVPEAQFELFVAAWELATRTCVWHQVGEDSVMWETK